MKTSITQAYLDTPLGQNANRILRNCVHCGFCNATCPTYQLLGDELDGPRGRIYLIKQVLEGQTASAKTQLHLDRCLTCRNCESTCPSGVQYSQLLDAGRKLVTDQVERPLVQKLQRLLIRKLLLSPRLFGVALRSGQLLRPLLPSSLKNTIPEKATTALSWPTTTQARKILLVEGCVQSALSPNIDLAAAHVLNHLGIQTLRTNAAGCCGAINHHLDAEQAALETIKRNIDVWWPLVETREIEAITMTASGCGVMIKEYTHHMGHDDDYAEKAKRISELYRDPSEIISPATTREITQTGSTSRKKLRVAFHPPCTLQHGMKITGIVETIINAIGHELVDFENKHLCCGSAGTYSITQKKLSRQLKKNKVDAIEANQPDIIVTANIGCLTQLQSGTNIPVRHWLELLS